MPPLRHIQGFVAALVEDYGSTLPAEARHYLDRVDAGSARMDRMIEALLRLSRVGRAPLQRQTLDLGDIARTAFVELAPAAGERSVEFVVGPLPPATGDPTLVRQLFDNLLTNALKFTGPVAAPRIEVGADSADGEVVLYVRDNGVGFEPEQRETIFGVFRRAHAESDFAGTGVGLSIVKRIVERHGGRVWADGAPGEGATFRFTLPAAVA